VIIIIGGGITGLSAAYELRCRQRPFVLLEASPRAGGLIFTERLDGFTLDAGPDSILAQKPAAMRLCEELGLTPRLLSTTPPRTAFVLKDGRLYPLPSPSVLGIPTSVSAIAHYDLLTWLARARIALEPLIPRRSPADESVASFFRRRFGSTTVNLIAQPLLGGIHAGDVERLSMRSLFPRLVDAERKPGGVLRNLASGRTPDPDGMFRSLRGGMGELTTAIVSRLPPDAIHLDAPATGLTRSGATWQVDARGQTYEGSAIVLAAPAHAAATLLAPIDAAAAQICGFVPYVSTASVALGWRRADIPHPLDGSGFVVARHGARIAPSRITACTWVSSKWEERVPDGHALVRAFIGGAHDPAATDLTDDELIDIAVRDISGVVGVATPPVLRRVFRWKNAGAQHVVGHHARMAGLAQRLAPSGIFVAGSGFDSIGIPDCVEHGRAAAAQAADYTRSKAAG